MAKESRSKYPHTFDDDDIKLSSSYGEHRDVLPYSNSNFDSSCKESILRKGKWTTEEEDYATKIISLFNRGLLPIGAGTTLRSYLSDKLHCDPMRITKKFAGASCIGKQVFQPCDGMSTDHSELEIEELHVLEVSYYRRVGDRSSTGFGDDEHSGLGSGVGTGTAASSSSRNASKHSGVKWNRVERQMEPSRSDFCREFEGAALKREGGGMRSVASAPDFSQMKRMHDTFKSADTAKTKSKRNLQAGSFKRNQRSQSVMNFLDFERYVQDDSAAGDLLLQFASRMGKTQHEREDKAASDDEGNFGPVLKLARLNGLNKSRVKEELGSRSGTGAAVAWKSMVGIKEEVSSLPYVEDETEEEKEDEEDEEEDDVEEDEDAYMVDQSTPPSRAGHPSQDEEDDDDQVGLNLTENEDHYPFHPDPPAIPRPISILLPASAPTPANTPAPTPVPHGLHSIPEVPTISRVVSTPTQVNTADSSNTDDNNSVHVCVSADSISDATAGAHGVKGAFKESKSPLLQTIPMIESKIEKRDTLLPCMQFGAEMKPLTTSS